LVFFSVILISDWLKLLHESKEENTINFVFLEMCKQKFEVTEFEFPSLQLLLSPKHYVPPIHCLFTFPKNYVPPSHCLFTFPKNYVPPSNCLFTFPKHYGPPIQCLFTKPKLFFPPFHFHFPCYCFDFVIENGGCWKEGHKAADLGILAWRFSNENAGDRMFGAK
jgi:hypothetical protein